MTTPADPNRPGAPTVREIAALTARLREISARGRDVDEAQRAAFLADKDALIARITDSTQTGAEQGDRDTPLLGTPAAREAMDGYRHEHTPRTGSDAVDSVITFEGAGYYSNADLAAIGDAIAAGDTELAQQLQDRPWTEDANTGTDGPVMPEWMREQAIRTQAELTDRTAEPADRDDQVAIAERVGELRAEHGPSPVEATISRAEAARQLTERGYDAASAQAMVAEYLHETSREVGVPVYQWGLDGHDVAAIAADYEWVDHHRGETLAQARERAAEHATGWAARAGTVDRERSPGYAAHAQAQAAQWATRATAPEPFTHPAAEADADGDPWVEERAHEQAFDELCERHPLPGEGPGYWVTDCDGARWDEGVVVDDATDPEITFAPSDIWDDEPGADQARAGAEWDAVRGDDPRSYATMMGDAARALGSVHSAGQDDAVRREQLARWHADDQTTENVVGAEQVDGAPVDLGRD